jgi:four helix bundle protein
MNAKSFEDLLVWQKAHAFVLEIYRVTEAFPKSELFVLTSQMRRAAISIPANIAEGFKKRTRPDKIRILNIAQGSLEESQYYRILARDLNYADTSVLRPHLDEVSKMLESYIRTIERNAGSSWSTRR